MEGEQYLGTPHKEGTALFHGIYQSSARLSSAVLMGSKHQSVLPELFSLLHVINISPKREVISSPKILQQFSMRNCTRLEICKKAVRERCQIFYYSTQDKLNIQMRNRSKLSSMKAARNYSLSPQGPINCPGIHPCKHLFHSTLSVLRSPQPEIFLMTEAFCWHTGHCFMTSLPFFQEDYENGLMNVAGALIRGQVLIWRGTECSHVCNQQPGWMGWRLAWFSATLKCFLPF